MIDQAQLARYIGAAHAAGMPADQLAGFIESGYVALPWLLPFHAAARQADLPDGPEQIGLGGSRGPGKSHGIFGQVALDDCQRQDDLKCLFLRQIQKVAAESFEDLVHRLLARVPHSFREDRVRFPNGSRILVGGFKDDADIGKYLGIEYDVIAIEESTQISEDRRTKLRGSLRTNKPGWRPRIYDSANPGGIGHSHFKKTFVLPWRAKQESRTRFFHGTFRDNPFLNPEYIRYLLELQGPLGKAWRDGDWDQFEGMAFETWNYERHTCEPFRLPADFPRWRSVDWGSFNPFCCLWWVMDPDTGRMWITREAYRTGLTDREQARLITSMTPKGEPIALTLADPSMWTKKSHEASVFSSADEYAAEGVPLTKADNNRIIGKRKVDQALGALDDGGPGVVIFRTCTNLIRTLPELPRDMDGDPEDVDTKAEDHLYDTMRYGLDRVKLRELPRAAPPPEPVTDRVALLLMKGQRGLASKDL
jgi:hypothetical protein